MADKSESSGACWPRFFRYCFCILLFWLKKALILRLFARSLAARFNFSKLTKEL